MVTVFMNRQHNIIETTGYRYESSGLTFKGPCIVIYSYNKSQRDALISQIYFDKELYMFRTDLLSIIRSLTTVYTATGICRASYVGCLIARSGS